MSIISLVNSAYAQGITNPVLPGSGEGGAQAGSTIVGKIVSSIIGVFFLAGFILAIFHFLFGAIRWITASGDKSALQNAQEPMSQAVVGLIVLAAIWGISMLLGTFLGWEGFDVNQLLIPLPSGL